MKNIILTIIGLNCLVYGLSPILKLNVSVDSSTGLEWQKELNKNQKKQTWIEAINYCEELNLNNKKDWRLPNIIELTSLVDETQVDPAIINDLRNSTLFGGFNYYWSSTSFSNSLDQAWFVGFHSGNQSTIGKLGVNYVRCVRLSK